MYRETDMKTAVRGLYGEDYISWEQVANDIESMYIRGANDIGRMSAYALHIFASNYEGKPENFVHELEQTASSLFHTRPTAVSLENALLFVLNSIDPVTPVEKMRESVLSSVVEFFNYATSSQDMVARLASELIEDGAIIHTHCNSTAVVRALIGASNEGKNITVHSTESRPRYQGRITARQLAGAGIPVKMMVDSAARLYMDEVDVVLVGADTITYRGELYNKIGTHQIALAARDCGIPLYTLAETFKFSPRSKAGEHTLIELRDSGEVAKVEDFAGVEILNPSFDHTPPELVRGIVTEGGIVSPENVSKVIDEKYGNMRTDYFY